MLTFLFFALLFFLIKPFQRPKNMLHENVFHSLFKTFFITTKRASKDLLLTYLFFSLCIFLFFKADSFSVHCCCFSKKSKRNKKNSKQQQKKRKLTQRTTLHTYTGKK